MPFRVLGPKGHLVVRKITGATLAKKLPALIHRFKRVTVTAAPAAAPDLRALVCHYARVGVSNEPRIHYAEIRPIPHKMTLPLTTDCSGFVTLCFELAGAPDPNRHGYDNGKTMATWTGSLLKNGKEIPLSQVRPGDVIVYGDYPGVHTAIIVAAGPDPLTVSHGQEGGPQYVHVSQDGRTPRHYLSFLP